MIGRLYPLSEVELEHKEAPPYAFKRDYLSRIKCNEEHSNFLLHKVSSAMQQKESLAPPQLFKQQNIVLRFFLHFIHIKCNEAISTDKEVSVTQMKHTLLDCIYKKDYLHFVNEKFDTTKWYEVEKIQDPSLIEQIIDIFLLCVCKNNPLNPGPLLNVWLFACQIAYFATLHDNSDITSNELLKNAEKFFGQLIYALDKEPTLLVHGIKNLSPVEMIEKVKKCYHERLKVICQSLENNFHFHIMTGLQHPEVALQTLIPKKISKMLITSNGSINFGIIPSLFMIFINQKQMQMNHEANLAHTLDLLRKSGRLRREIENIGCPSSSQLRSNGVIRVALGLPHDHQITFSTTRRAVLAAILSHLRQGENKSCFAISLAIEILSDHIHFYIRDIKQWIENGHMIRTINGTPKKIPFMERMSDPDLEKNIAFSSNGFIFVNNTAQSCLWDSLGIQAICLSLHLGNPKIFLSQFLKDLDPTGERTTFEMKIRRLIHKLCLFIKKKSSLSLIELYHQATFAFSSQVAPTLLRVWENSIANMVEADEKGMIKDSILQSVVEAIQIAMTKGRVIPTQHTYVFIMLVQKYLLEFITLQYDPSIMSESEETEEGGFVLYVNYARIDQPELFMELIKNIVIKTYKKVMANISVEFEKIQFKAVFESLLDSFQSNLFLFNVLVHYHVSTKAVLKHLSKNAPIPFKDLTHTPWITKEGNKSKQILKVYFGSNQPIPSLQFTSTNALDAMTQIIDFCKKMSHEEKRKCLENYNRRIPLCILGKHRFPFMPGHSSLVSAWKSPSRTEEWIQQSVIAPGQEISCSEMDQDTHQMILKQFEEKLSAKFFLSMKSEEFIKAASTISIKLSIAEYRKEMLQLCQRQNCLKAPSLLQKFTRHLDSAICESLPLILRNKMRSSAVHFADTNWSDGLQDINFCFAVNPCNGKLEIWEIHANGSQFIAIDQLYWLINQKWELFTIKDLSTDDHDYYLK